MRAPVARSESVTAQGARVAQRWRAFAGALTVVAATFAAVPVAGSAHAATIDTSAYYVLVSRHSGKAIDVNGASMSDGASIVQWTRTDSNNQQWQFVDAGGGNYQLRARHSGKVLAIAQGSTADGADVVQATSTAATSQQFRVVDTDSGYVKLINRNSGKALDLWGWSTTNGGRISQYTDSGGANQQWQLIKVGTNAMGVVAAMEPGWNLGNSLDAVGSDETAWGNPAITQSLINNIKAQGFNSIRIPVTWSAHQGGAPNYTIEAAYLARVKQVVDWAVAADLYVLLNVHHDSWQWVNKLPADHDNVLARYNATWTQIASTFRDSSTKVLYESINEPTFRDGAVPPAWPAPSDAQNAQLLNELNVNFHRIVRASGGNNATRVLVLPTLHTSADQARIDELLATFNALNDPNLAATMHYYGYWPFSVNIAGSTRYDATTHADLTANFDRQASGFIARGIPVILGEYGLLGFDKHTGTVEQGEKLKFFEYLGHYARTKGLTTMWWDNGQHLDRTSFQWKDPELFAQVRSSWTTRSGTASEDFIYTARSSSITAKTITINRNGTTFQGVRQGTTWLTYGTDYTLDGDRLTFTASALTRLSGSRAYGVNAQVHLVFSQGVPWRVDIRTYDPPVLQNATGTTKSFAIPTSFRGDQLATVEAKYADGTNAGPANWTSFKEFTRAFEPNYSGNSIALAITKTEDDGTTSMPTDLFSEVVDGVRVPAVNDGARVTLTFHFWSGARVTYYVTRNGTSVTGSTS